MSRWFALYSQTGSELLSICEELRIHPDAIITNNPITRNVFLNAQYATHEEIMEWLKETLEPDDIVTLHGYLRIIPEEVIETGARIYNGHPGLITMYPELKGKDPQKKVEQNRAKYKHVGSVIHEVTGEVDAGRVVRVSMRRLYPHDRVTEVLRGMSLELWVNFLKEELYVEVN